MTTTDDSFFINNDLRITCIDATELVTNYLDNALVGLDLANFETHLSLCEGCQAFTDQITKTIALVGAGHRREALLPASFDQLLQTLAQATASDR